MKFLHSRECIDAKMQIFPQEADEYFQLKAALNAAKSRADKAAANLRLKEKIRELKHLYSELDRYIYDREPHPNRAYITYKKPAIQRTYTMLHERGVPELDARLQIAYMLQDIHKMWIESAKYHYSYKNRSSRVWRPTLEEVVSWPGLIGFPDPKVDAPSQP
jgi:hypothetical protein